MSKYPAVYLKRHEDRRILAGHLWIYNNEIDTHRHALKKFTPGQLVTFMSAQDKPVGIGYINPHTLLCGRLLTHDITTVINKDFFVTRITQALALREKLYSQPCYRLIFGESDFLPGVVVDRYADTLVVQINTYGMENLLPEFIDALEQVIKPTNILLKNESSMRQLEGLETYTKAALGEPPEIITLEENKLKFNIPLLAGQKTGWFYDQKENRTQLLKFVKDKTVLDVFSYIGAWGVSAAAYGASDVTCIDSSAPALALVTKNAELNQVQAKVKTRCGDAFDELKKLKNEKAKFDVIILDPPAFIKKRKDINAGVKGYLHLHELALSLLTKNGLLISASCSLHLQRETLVDIINTVSVKQKCNAQIIGHGYQGPDHPIHPAIPETSYLKALFTYLHP